MFLAYQCYMSEVAKKAMICNHDLEFLVENSIFIMAIVLLPSSIRFPDGNPPYKWT